MSQETLAFRWYFGGLAGAGGVVVTHPLDLVRVHLSEDKPAHTGMVNQSRQLVGAGGWRVLYRGLPIAVMRQIVFNTPTFGLYQVAKRRLAPPAGTGIPYYQRTVLAAMSGCLGGVLGTPLETLTVRTQMEASLNRSARTSYRGMWDSLALVVKTVGVRGLFKDCGWTAVRKSLVAVGGMGGYDQIKISAMDMGAQEGVATHALCGLGAGVGASLCEVLAIAIKLQIRGRSGVVFGFLRRFGHSFVRLGPQTAITFVFLEQLRLNFGLPIK